VWGILGVIFNIRVRTSCFLIGIAFLCAILACRSQYSNGGFFTASIMILTSLHRKGEYPWLILCQLVLMYFGAGLNKILDPDWTGGVYLEHWLYNIIHYSGNMTVSEMLPPLADGAVSRLAGRGTTSTSCLQLS